MDITTLPTLVDYSADELREIQRLVEVELKLREINPRLRGALRRDLWDGDPISEDVADLAVSHHDDLHRAAGLTVPYHSCLQWVRYEARVLMGKSTITSKATQ